MIDEGALKRIEELHRLKSEGIITEADFEKAKDSLLGGVIAPRRPAAPVRVSEPIQFGAAEDYMAWVLLPLRRYADFNGRSTRKEFWMFQLVFVALTLVTLLLIGKDGVDEYGEANAFGVLVIGAFLLALLGLIVPQIAVQVRRFHDQDKSGWFALINLIPYLGSLVVLVFMCIEGTRGENQFGPDPKE